MMALAGINWEAGERFEISVPDNAFADGSREVAITHSIASADPEYELLPALAPEYPWPVSVEIVDDDAAGVLYETSVVVVEGGAPTAFLVRLATTPFGNVTVTFALDDPSGRLALLASEFLWTPGAWDTPYALQVATATDDQVFTGSSTARILASVTSDDAAYAALAPPPIQVRVDDNDAARVVLDRSGLPEGGQLLRLVEGGGGAVVPVYLASRPVAGATVRVRLLSGGQVSMSPAELVFTAANFSTPVPVAVRAVDDAAIEAAIHYDDIGVLVEATDAFYDGMQVTTRLTYPNLHIRRSQYLMQVLKLLVLQ